MNLLQAETLETQGDILSQPSNCHSHTQPQHEMSKERIIYLEQTNFRLPTTEALFSFISILCEILYNLLTKPKCYLRLIQSV